MLRLLVYVFALIIGIATCVSGWAQTGFSEPVILQKIAAFSETEASDDVWRAGQIASELADTDFSPLGFTPHEARELSAGLVEALIAAGRHDQAANLLDTIANGDRGAYQNTNIAEEKSFYRDTLIKRLTRLAELDELRGNGDRLIEDLSLIYELLEEQLGRDHPDVSPVSNDLVTHLQARAHFFSSADQAKSASNDFWRAYILSLRSSRSNRAISDNLFDEMTALSLSVSDLYMRRGDGNGAIEWLQGQSQKMNSRPIGGMRAPVQVVQTLTRHYQQRAIYYESLGDYGRADSALTGARREIEALGGAGIADLDAFNNFHAKLLRERAEKWLALHDYSRAYQTANQARALYPKDPILDAEIERLLERAYRVYHQIPDGQPIRMPPRPPKRVIVQEATTSYTNTVTSEKFKAVRVFYGTNRKSGGKNFTGKGAGPLTYGWAQVTVPKKRVDGEITRPFSGFRPRDEKHFILKRTRRYTGVTEFGQRLRASLACADQVFYEDASEPRCERTSAGPSELFIYVHGHATPFQNTALRTAQLAVDLDMENGAVFFAWPTGGHALAYRTSEKYSRQSRAQLVSFLETVISQSEADQIHLIAHSMGNRVLLNALYDIKSKTSPGRAPFFDQIIFASPDVDQDDFVKDVKTVESLSNGMTLYASNKDKALILSSKINAEKRAGLAPPDPQIINATTRLTVIDTSDVKRKFLDLIDHDDYTGGAFNDIRSVLWTGAKPDNRCVLAKQQRCNNRPFWKAKSFNPGCTMQAFGETLIKFRKNRFSGLAPP